MKFWSIFVIWVLPISLFWPNLENWCYFWDTLYKELKTLVKKRTHRPLITIFFYIPNFLQTFRLLSSFVSITKTSLAKRNKQNSKPKITTQRNPTKSTYTKRNHIKGTIQTYRNHTKGPYKNGNMPKRKSKQESRITQKKTQQR